MTGNIVWTNDELSECNKLIFLMYWFFRLDFRKNDVKILSIKVLSAVQTLLLKVNFEPSNISTCRVLWTFKPSQFFNLKRIIQTGTAEDKKLLNQLPKLSWLAVSNKNLILWIFFVNLIESFFFTIETNF